MTRAYAEVPDDPQVAPEDAFHLFQLDKAEEAQSDRYRRSYLSWM